MSTETIDAVKKPKSFFLISVDVLQGFIIWLMVFGHTILYWRHDAIAATSLTTMDVWKYGIVYEFVILAGSSGFMLLIFLYGLNTVNSMLRRKDFDSHQDVRKKFLKRGLIFLVFGSMADILMGIVFGDFFRWFFTFHIFHVYSFSTFALLFLYEIVIKMKKEDFAKTFTWILGSVFLVMLGLFVLLHDYNFTGVIEDPTNLNIDSILKNIFLDIGKNPILPYGMFSILGGCVAGFLNIPKNSTEKIKRQSILLLIPAAISFIIAVIIMNFGTEPYTSTIVDKITSMSVTIMSIALILFFFVFFFLWLDLNTMFTQKLRDTPKIVLPLVMISKISLTVYFVHSFPYFIDPTNITEDVFFIANWIYSCGFIVLAFVWVRYRFKYSLEWFISKI